MEFHEVRFPVNIAFGSSGGPSRNTTVVTSASGKEQRNLSWEGSRRGWDAGYGMKSLRDIEAVVSFFEERRGRFIGFRWRDRFDYKSCPLRSNIDAMDQPLGKGDGTTTQFQLIKRYGADFDPYDRPIFKPVTGTVVIGVDGVATGSGWTVDTTTGIVTFSSAPSEGEVITAGFEFDVPVRFNTDMIEVNLDHFEAGEIPTVPVIELVSLSSIDNSYDEETPDWYWEDVFKDWSGSGGEDWSGWGLTYDKPIQEPVLWFMENVMSNGDYLSLQPVSGRCFLTDRMQFPSESVIKNWTVDLGTTIIERGRANTLWGQFFLWGQEYTFENIQPVLAVNAYIGDTSVTLADDDMAADFLALAGPGSIAMLRTNATSENYHPAESRDTLIISSISGLTLNLARPLEIDAPVVNPVGDFPGEVDDDTTVILAVGSTLHSDAAAGDTTIYLDDASNLSAGNWVYITTSETPSDTNNQFASTIGVQLDPGQDFGTLLMNQEFHQIKSVTEDAPNSRWVVVLEEPLKKPKHTAFFAACVKVDPVMGGTIKGGRFVGHDDFDETVPWEHQYIWARYCVGTTVIGTEGDTDPTRKTNYRRSGHVVRFDTGVRNLVDGIIAGPPASVGPGYGYGMSFRLGERDSIVQNCLMMNCRHGIEMWSTSGGVIIQDNELWNTASSDIDTHGSWNRDITIRRNFITRPDDDSPLAPDLGSGIPDAIRVGNNKFIFDEDITIEDNVITNFRGTCLNIVPGSRRVSVDGMTCLNVDRVLRLTQNQRHPDLVSEDITIENVTADQVYDRITEISNGSSTTHHVDGLILRDWTIGASGIGTVGVGGIHNIRILNADNVELTRVVLQNIEDDDEDFAWNIQNCDTVTFTDCEQYGGERGIRLHDVTNVSGNIHMKDLNGTIPYVAFEDGTSSGSLTVTYAGFTPSHSAVNITVLY